MTEKCTALVLRPRQLEQKVARMRAIHIAGHRFTAEIGWKCETCGLPRPRCLLASKIPPCHTPTPSVLELAVALLFGVDPFAPEDR